MTAEGSLAAAFVPIFTGYLRNRTEKEAWEFAQKVFWDMAILLGVAVLLGVLFSRQIVSMLTLFGSDSRHWALAVSLNRIIFPSVFFIGLAALAAAILNSFHVFAIPAATSVVFNISFIAFSFPLIYRPTLRLVPANLRMPAVALGIGILLGAALQLAIQIPALLKRGMDFRASPSMSDPGVRQFGRLMGPGFFGMGVYQINIFVDTLFATSSRMPTGSITSLYIADRVMQLVLGSYAIAMSTAILPTMSHQLAAGKLEEMKHTFGFALRIVSFITIPATVGLVLLRDPIIQVLFQHGRFSAQSTALTANALLYYSLGLPAFAAIKLITPMYYSAQDTATPARVGACALGANIVLNAAFLLFAFRYLSNGSPALASSLAAYFNFALLFVFFRKRYGRLGFRGLAASLAKMAVCASAMGVVTYGAVRAARFAQIGHILAQAGTLAGMIAASVAIYLALASILRCKELSEFPLLMRRLDGEAMNPKVSY